MDYGLSSQLPKNDERQPLWEQQRKERGFDDTETWALDFSLAKLIAPRLKVFKESHFCHPHSLTMEQWDEILQKMIDGFEEAAQRDDKMSNWDYAKVKEGLDLFAEWYTHLWW